MLESHLLSLSPNDAHAIDLGNGSCKQSNDICTGMLRDYMNRAYAWYVDKVSLNTHRLEHSLCMYIHFTWLIILKVNISKQLCQRSRTPCIADLKLRGSSLSSHLLSLSFNSYITLPNIALLRGMIFYFERTEHVIANVTLFQMKTAT